MVLDRFSPDCCDPVTPGPCRLFAHTFEDDPDSFPAVLPTELTSTAGSWEIVDGKLKPKLANSRIVYTGDNTHGSMVGRVNTVRGSLGAIIQFHTRWKSATDNIYIQLEYKSDHGEVTFHRNGSQIGTSKKAHDILPDTDHAFHWFVASSVLLNYRPVGDFDGNSFFEPDLPGEWLGWNSSMLGHMFVFNFPDIRRASSRSPSYSYLRHDAAASSDGLLWAITVVDDTGVEFGAIDTFRTTEQYDPFPQDAFSCAIPFRCQHANGKPDITPNINADSGWVATSDGVECPDADSLYLFKHELQDYPAINWEIKFEVESGTRSDGVEVVFDYVDSSNYKFWRVNATADSGTDYRGNQFGEVVAGVETATAAIGIGDTDPAILTVNSDAWYNPEKYGNAPFETPILDGALVGFKTLSTNVGKIIVRQFNVTHGLRPIPAEPTSVCASSGELLNSVFFESRHPHKWQVVVTGGDIPGTYNFELNQPKYGVSYNSHRQWWEVGSDPFKGINTSTSLTIGHAISNTGTADMSVLIRPLGLFGPIVPLSDVQINFGSGRFANFSFADDTDGLTVSAKAHSSLTLMGAGASATITAVP